MYSLLIKLADLFRPMYFLREEHEPIDEIDKSNLDALSVSGTSYSLQKTLRNRIRDRKAAALRFVKEGNVLQAAVFTSQIEELEDIIREWNNRKEDNERKSKAYESN